MATGVENLVFQGGGVKGIAYVGAVELLEQRGLLAGVRGVAGASAGAFTAMLLGVGCDAAAMKRIVLGTDFPTLEDHFDPLRLATRYGLYAGQALFDWIAGAYVATGFPVDATFAEHAARGGRDLRVFATDLTTRDAREFSLRTTPDASVVGAVRASMSIPLMFAAWRFADGKPDDHLYVDGGVVINYPIDAFDDDGHLNPGTVGMRLVAAGATPKPNFGGFDHPVIYARALYECLLDAQSIDVEHSSAQMGRTVQIDDFGFSATDFHLSTTDYQRLFESGRSAMAAFLDASG